MSKASFRAEVYLWEQLSDNKVVCLLNPPSNSFPMLWLLKYFIIQLFFLWYLYHTCSNELSGLRHLKGSYGKNWKHWRSVVEGWPISLWIQPSPLGGNSCICRLAGHCLLVSLWDDGRLEWATQMLEVHRENQVHCFWIHNISANFHDCSSMGNYPNSGTEPVICLSRVHCALQGGVLQPSVLTIGITTGDISSWSFVRANDLSTQLVGVWLEWLHALAGSCAT